MNWIDPIMSFRRPLDVNRVDILTENKIIVAYVPVPHRCSDCCLHVSTSILSVQHQNKNKTIETTQVIVMMATMINTKDVVKMAI